MLFYFIQFWGVYKDQQAVFWCKIEKIALREGALAQLGERLLCTQEVSGSIPLGSIRYESVLSTKTLK